MLDTRKNFTKPRISVDRASGMNIRPRVRLIGADSGATTADRRTGVSTRWSVVELHATSGTFLTSNDDGPALVLCSRIVRNFTEAGPYVLRVRGFGGGSGEYTVGLFR